MARSSTRYSSFDKLAAKGDMGGVLLRLMMALNDFVIADEGLRRWKEEETPRLQSRKRAAAQYFLRLMFAHIHEALEIVREIANEPELAKAVDFSDAQTRESFTKLTAFLGSEGHKLITIVRNNGAFHYPKAYTLKSIARLATKPSRKPLAVSMGTDALDWRFEPAEHVMDDIVTADIFRLGGDGQAPQHDIDEIVVRLQDMGKILADFAAYFIKHHA